jgi:hypothetical protein
VSDIREEMALRNCCARNNCSVVSLVELNTSCEDEDIVSFSMESPHLSPIFGGNATGGDMMSTFLSPILSPSFDEPPVMDRAEMMIMESTKVMVVIQSSHRSSPEHLQPTADVTLRVVSVVTDHGVSSVGSSNG